MINFQVFEAVSFAVVAGLVMYMARNLLAWFWRGITK